MKISSHRIAHYAETAVIALLVSGVFTVFGIGYTSLQGSHIFGQIKYLDGNVNKALRETEENKQRLDRADKMYEATIIDLHMKLSEIRVKQAYMEVLMEIELNHEFASGMSAVYRKQYFREQLGKRGMNPKGCCGL